MKISTRDIRRDDLFDLLVAHPDGLTINDIAMHLNCTLDRARLAVRDLRALLADDSITVPCTPQGAREPWLYELAGDVDSVNAYVAYRTTDMRSRVETTRDIAQTRVNATDGRTYEGKHARTVYKHMTRLVEDLDELDAQA